MASGMKVRWDVSAQSAWDSRDQSRLVFLEPFAVRFPVRDVPSRTSWPLHLPFHVTPASASPSPHQKGCPSTPISHRPPPSLLGPLHDFSFPVLPSTWHVMYWFFSCRCCQSPGPTKACHSLFALRSLKWFSEHRKGCSKYVSNKRTCIVL